jgi:hypothetical protein
MSSDGLPHQVGDEYYCQAALTLDALRAAVGPGEWRLFGSLMQYVDCLGWPAMHARAHHGAPCSTWIASDGLPCMHALTTAPRPLSLRYLHGLSKVGGLARSALIAIDCD